MMKKVGVKNTSQFEVTGCPKCDEPSTGLCNKHKLEYLKWVADTARNEYESELKAQSRKGKNEHCTDYEFRCWYEGHNLFR